MALQQVKFAPGIDKQDTSVGAVGRWVESDNVRFRYGLPEKVGGWQSLLNESIVGVTRKLHSFVDLEGNRYTAIGTDKFLLIYFEGQLFDITPFRSNNAGVQTTFTSSTLATNSTSITNNVLLQLHLTSRFNRRGYGCIRFSNTTKWNWIKCYTI